MSLFQLNMYMNTEPRNISYRMVCFEKFLLNIIYEHIYIMVNCDTFNVVIKNKNNLWA